MKLNLCSDMLLRQPRKPGTWGLAWFVQYIAFVLEGLREACIPGHIMDQQPSTNK